MNGTAAFLSLGSNRGDRQANLARALNFLQSSRQVRMRKISPLYRTAPVGPKQREFLNLAVRISTRLSPEELLNFLKEIEKRMGRKKGARYGPRKIDLDLIFYGRRKIDSPRLTVPHPRFHRRRFVLQPLADIAPRLVPVGFKKTIAQIHAQLTDLRQKVKLFGMLSAGSFAR